MHQVISRFRSPVVVTCVPYGLVTRLRKGWVKRMSGGMMMMPESWDLERKETGDQFTGLAGQMELLARAFRQSQDRVWRALVSEMSVLSAGSGARITHTSHRSTG